MAAYVVCHKKRNAPRLNTRICQEKCPLKNECKEYLSTLNGALKQGQVPVDPERPAVVLPISP